MHTLILSDYIYASLTVLFYILSYIYNHKTKSFLTEELNRLAKLPSYKIILKYTHRLCLLPLLIITCLLFNFSQKLNLYFALNGGVNFSSYAINFIFTSLFLISFIKTTYLYVIQRVKQQLSRYLVT